MILKAHGEALDVVIKGMHVGLLIGYEGEEQDAFPLEVFNVAVVVEETVVLHNFKDIPFCFEILMRIIYLISFATSEVNHTDIHTFVSYVGILFYYMKCITLIYTKIYDFFSNTEM